MGNVIACAVALPMALPLGPHSGTDWAILVYLGVVQIGLAYADFRAMVRLTALEASVLLLLEPVLNPCGPGWRTARCPDRWRWRAGRWFWGPRSRARG